jgi:hypothetical protein
MKIAIIDTAFNRGVGASGGTGNASHRQASIEAIGDLHGTSFAVANMTGLAPRARKGTA